METKICKVCQQELPIDQFYSRGNGKTRLDCKECHKIYVLEQMQKRKELVDNYKIKCEKCGYNKCKEALEFHHKNPQDKNETIARMRINKNKIQDITNEISKCIVLCANCHREFHTLEKDYGITLDEYLNNY